MKVLITGVGGQLGYDVCKQLDHLGIENKGVDVADFDLTDGDAVMAYVRDMAPDAIIHCAATIPQPAPIKIAKQTANIPRFIIQPAPVTSLPLFYYKHRANNKSYAIIRRRRKEYV